MTKLITLQFEIEDDELKEFLEQEEVGGDLHAWVFGEICQNHGFGFLTDCKVENVKA